LFEEACTRGYNHCAVLHSLLSRDLASLIHPQHDPENLVAEAARKGALLVEALRSRLGDQPHVGEIRGKGLMCAVEFVKDRNTKTPFAPEEQVGARIYAAAVAQGLFSRVRGDTFVLAPAFVRRTRCSIASPRSWPRPQESSVSDGLHGYCHSAEQEIVVRIHEDLEDSASRPVSGDGREPGLRIALHFQLLFEIVLELE
jgi:hypothetical protein